MARMLMLRLPSAHRSDATCGHGGSLRHPHRSGTLLPPSQQAYRISIVRRPLRSECMSAYFCVEPTRY